MVTSVFGIPVQYNVHDILVQHTGTFTPTGQWKSMTQVRYYIGTHSPFQLTYEAGQDTADAIKADIQKQVDLLRAIGA